jgi:maltokinase
MATSPAPGSQADADELPIGVEKWMMHQRWYAAKGNSARLERRGGWTAEHGGSSIHTHLVLDRQAGRATLYQVPLSYRTERLDGVTAIVSEPGHYVYDAPHDPNYAAAILSRIHADQSAADPRLTRVLTGEQSNTSIICEMVDGPPVILKIFRALHHGDNPDIVLQEAIAATGSHVVPSFVGSLSATWADKGQPNGAAHGHIAFAQEFLPGAEDAWRVAVRAAGNGTDFSTEARELGAATGDIHRILAEVMPTRQTTTKNIDQAIEAMQARLATALDEVPELEPHRERIHTVLESTRSADWPRLQRIHGDLHLGQVLAAPHRGWVMVDFEGEPLRSMAERSEPDFTLRDVAGMLRSFDYVAGTVAGTVSVEQANAWAARARDAFLTGYSDAMGIDLGPLASLLAAFELDKALYETVYEARNRPDWVRIPLAAVLRLSA